MIDVVSGKIKALTWKSGTKDVIEALPIRDSVMAIADESYFDWSVLPETPTLLGLSPSGNAIKLTFAIYGGEATGIVVERQIVERSGDRGNWQRIAKLSAGTTEYTDSGVSKGQQIGYRVRAFNGSGESAYSNVARIPY